MLLLLLVVAPVRERGLKFLFVYWKLDMVAVAPVRERGLKLILPAVTVRAIGRSREGARIEIGIHGDVSMITTVAPVRERGLK